jgi:phosphoglycerate dehydrogenase-like enzyme
VGKQALAASANRVVARCHSTIIRMSLFRWRTGPCWMGGRVLPHLMTIISDPDAIVACLLPFDIICVMRERTPMTRAVIERLPRLRLIASTATRNASIDIEAAKERGIQVVHTGYSSAPTIELTLALILSSARHLVDENSSLRGGGWQRFIGDDLGGRTLGLLGVGNIGSAVAQIGKAFGMTVIAWSQNLTAERAAAAGAVLVSKDELFRQADFVSIHLVLSARTRGLVGAAELALMKPTARLVNTSRGPIVIEAHLLEALRYGKIAGAAIDVFDQEPLPVHHPFRSLPNLLATPHIGYVSRGLYQRFYQDTADNIDAIAFYLQPLPQGAWKNEVTVRSGRLARMYEPGHWAARVAPTPLLMIVALADTITLTDLQLRAFERMLEPKKLATVEGGHFDPYLEQFPRASTAAIS